jgi:hypothetical protein
MAAMIGSTISDTMSPAMKIDPWYCGLSPLTRKIGIQPPWSASHCDSGVSWLATTIAPHRP